MEAAVRSTKSIAMAIIQRRDKQRWCNNNVSCGSSSIELVKMCNQTTFNNHRKCRNLRKKLSNDLSNQQKFIAIALIAIYLLVNCTNNAVTASTLNPPTSYLTPVNQINLTAPHGAWKDFQKKMLHQRSVPAYQSPQDLGDILTQLGLLIQSRQRNATELASNIFFKYYNT